MGNSIFRKVLASIQLYYQFNTSAVKVSYKAADCLLPLKADRISTQEVIP